MLKKSLHITPVDYYRFLKTARSFQSSIHKLVNNINEKEI